MEHCSLLPVEPGVRLVSCRTAGFLIVVSRRGCVSREWPPQACTQGFEPLIKSIITHVVDLTVDIIVSGARLCTNTAHQAEVDIK